MLKEYTQVAQSRGVAGKRRWFSDDEMDLIVWYADSGAVVGFQLCYDRTGKERAFTWDDKYGMRHALVDGGEESPLRNDTPILMPGGVPDVDGVLQRFREQAAEVDPEIVALVTLRLEGSRR
jgi:hypothetical protein